MDKVFMPYKQAMEASFNIGGVGTLVHKTWQESRQLALSYIPGQEERLVVHRLQQLCTRVRALIAVSFGVYSDQITKAFDKRVKEGSNSSSSGGSTPVPGGEYDVYEYWRMVLARYNVHSKYTVASIYTELLQLHTLKDSDTGPVLQEKLQTLDKKLSELNDKPLTFNVITEGLAIHSAIRLIPEHWAITKGILSNPALTFESIMAAVDQYQALKSSGKHHHYNSHKINMAQHDNGNESSRGNYHNSRDRGRSRGRGGQRGRGGRGGYRGSSNNSNHRPYNTSNSNSTKEGHTPQPHLSMVTAYYLDNDDNDNDGPGNSDPVEGTINYTSSDGTLRYGQEREWILDSGATLHCSGSKLTDLETRPTMRLTYANGGTADVHKFGSAPLTSRLTLVNVAQLKHGSPNLCSLSRLVHSGCMVEFNATSARVYNKDKTHLITFRRAPNTALWIYTTGSYNTDHEDKGYKLSSAIIPRKSDRSSSSNSSSSSSPSSSNSSSSTAARASLIASRANIAMPTPPVSATTSHGGPVPKQ